VPARIDAAQFVIKPRSAFSIARFRFDITPPLNHPLLGGMVPRAVAVDDPLECAGYVLLGAGAPLVVCVLDWAALAGGAHRAWRMALAEAAGTTPDRVAVQCVHQHNAPFVCDEAAVVAAGRPGLAPIFDPVFFEQCLTRARATVRSALADCRPLTHVGHGEAMVQQVGSNRRIDRDGAGRIAQMRKSACDDETLRALPEGKIDPWLRTVAFYDGAERIVASHYYATHPMSYYRDGRVSSDFCGLARKRRQKEEPGCLHLYFSGCAGDVAAGKYNDGSRAARVELTDRVHAAMLEAEQALVTEPLQVVEWRSTEMLPPPRRDVSAEQLEAKVADPTLPEVPRLLAAFQLGWCRRFARGGALPLNALHLNDAAILNLPGEVFVDFQLRAQAMHAGRPVLVAAYGDDGPWYVPPRSEYPAGGYEIECAFCDPSIDELMTEAIRRLLE
jgi:hypothetical protein